MPLADAARTRFLIGIVLSILVLVSYGEVTENGFIAFDDPQYVTENPQVQKGLGRETAIWAFTTSQASNWHPLTWLSLLLDRELYGGNPPGYHWTNVVLHLLGGLMLFLALGRMTGLLYPSGLVAALFLVHPLHVESVAWVAERKDVLSGLFWMAGLWCYARYAERPAVGRYLWVLFCFVCGLLSKPMVVTFPFVLLLLDWWPLGRRITAGTVWGRLVIEKLPFFLLSATASVITFVVQQQSQAIAPLSAMALGARLANAIVSYTAYLGKTVWPANLLIFYPLHGPPPVGVLAVSFVTLLLITACALFLARRRPYLPVGWFWYLGTLFPVIGLVQVGSQAMADRYTYLPLVGIFIIVVWGGRELLAHSRGRRIGLALISAVIVVLFVSLTRNQVGYWRDTETLFERALRTTERNFMAHQILAEERAKSGDLMAAEQHFREAIAIKPAFKQAYNGLGHLLMIQGRLQEAAPPLEKVLALDPAFVPAMKNLGDVRMRQGRLDDALELYKQAVLLGEKDPELLNNYGVALYFKGKTTEAIRNIRAAVALKPDYAEALENLGKIVGHEVPSGGQQLHVPEP